MPYHAESFGALIPGLVKLTPRRFPDDRGFFTSPLQLDELRAAMGAEHPEDFDVVQVNHSRSTAGVLRGVHVNPWHKLVYLARGDAYVAVVDVRDGNRGAVWQGELKEGESVFVPYGCGNSFQALSDVVDYVYFTSGIWTKDTPDAYFQPLDPALGISWPVRSPALSEKDRDSKPLAETDTSWL